MPVRKARQALPAEVQVEPQPVLPPPLLTEEYPESDGRPMAESGFQWAAIMKVGAGLQLHYRLDPGVLVTGNIFIYYVRGDSSKCVAPDLLVAKGVGSRVRPKYLVWEEGRPPDFVLEVASPSTWEIDETVKPGIYERMGVREYFQCDPNLDRPLLPERLKGRRLRRGAYEDLPAMHGLGGTVAVHSDVLDLDLQFDGERLNLWDPNLGRFVSLEDEAQAREVAEAEAEAAARKSRQLEARLAAIEAASPRGRREQG